MYDKAKMGSLWVLVLGYDESLNLTPEPERMTDLCSNNLSSDLASLLMEEEDSDMTLLSNTGVTCLSIPSCSRQGALTSAPCSPPI